MTTNQLPLDSARALRDGGIDAMAALNSALSIAISCAPDHIHSELKLAVGRAMASVMTDVVNFAIATHPNLEPSDEVWSAVVRERAAARASAFDD